MRALLVLALALVLAACGGSATPLEAAKQACGGPDDTASLGDDGRSLFLDGAGEDYRSGGLKITTTVCYLDELGTSDAVRRRMERTRALDGTREGAWDGLSATWQYHPDDGLDILIELQK